MLSVKSLSQYQINALFEALEKDFDGAIKIIDVFENLDSHKEEYKEMELAFAKKNEPKTDSVLSSLEQTICTSLNLEKNLELVPDLLKYYTEILKLKQ